jgi:hypothetical protein
MALNTNPGYTGSGSGVPTQTGFGLGGNLLGGILGSLLIPGLGSILGAKLGGMAGRGLARSFQGGQQLNQPTATAQPAADNKGGGGTGQPAQVAAPQPAANNKGGGTGQPAQTTTAPAQPAGSNKSGSPDARPGGQMGGFNIPGGINWAPGSPGGQLPNSWQMLIYSRQPQFRQYLDQKYGMTPNQWLLQQGAHGMSGTAAAGGYTGRGIKAGN